MTGGGAWTGCDIGGATGGARAPPPVGGNATRCPPDEPRVEVVPDDAAFADAVECPAKPMAATAERTAAATSDTATAPRVINDTDSIPRSREWAIRRDVEEPRELMRMSLMRRSLGNGRLGLIGNGLENDMNAGRALRHGYHVERNP